MTEYFKPIPFPLWAEDKQAFADALGRSFRETGFAVIEKHPLDAAIVKRALDAAKAFFKLPADVKEKYHDAKGGRQRGYTPFGVENAKGNTEADQKEFWHTGRNLPGDSPYRDTMKPNAHIDEIAEFDDATYAFYEALDEFGAKLLEGVAIHLGLDEGWFDNKVENGNSILRLLHYPPQENPPPVGSVRAGAHEDINVITLLLGAEEAGLQALHRSGEWLTVSPPPDSIVINCGDMLQRLTGGVLPSTTHRVLNPVPERAKFPRFSTPFFLHFNQDFMIEALPQCVAEGGKAETPITAQDYLMERLREIGLMPA